MKTLAEVEFAFRENFLVVANVITQSGAQLAFNVSGSAGGVGGLPTIIIRRLDRGFGLCAGKRVYHPWDAKFKI